METEKGRFHVKNAEEIIRREQPYLIFECSCQMSRTSEKQVKIRGNNNARAQWRCIFWWASGSRRVYRSLKGTSQDGGKEKSENQRWRRGKERQGGDAEIERRYPPTRHGTIIRRINGMRFWNFVLFVRPVISIDESRGRHWFLLRVFYSDIFRRLTRVIFQ